MQSLCPICKGKGSKHLGLANPIHDLNARFQAQSLKCGEWDVNNPDDLPRGWLIRERQPASINQLSESVSLTLEVYDPKHPDHYFWLSGIVPIEAYRRLWERKISSAE